MRIRDEVKRAMLGWGEGAVSDAEAEAQLDELETVVTERVLTDPTRSDHTAYRELADAVGRQIGALAGDANNWDGDSDELTILEDWLKVSGEWLPEMYAHLAAEKIRKTYGHPAQSGSSDEIANRMDPWGPDQSTARWGALIRKSDGAEVPWQIASAAELLISEWQSTP